MTSLPPSSLIGIGLQNSTSRYIYPNKYLCVAYDNRLRRIPCNGCFLRGLEETNDKASTENLSHGSINA